MTTSNHTKHSTAPRLRVLSALLALAACGGAYAQHAKLDGALSDLVDQQSRRQLRSLAVDTDEFKPYVKSLSDAQGRVLVDIYLEAGTSIDDFKAQLEASGAQVTGVNRAFNNGAISAYVPTSALAALSGTSGLHLAKLTRRPHKNVGLTTSQGAPVLRSNVANAAGWTGAGITVGVLSDSYDASPLSFTTVRAANDIASGDLRPPKWVLDIGADPSNTDEGRAMMQIVQDVAPGADQCFATAFAGEAAFADNIRRLRTEPACRADVIVDDVFYYDEPFFSDGQVAQAVNDVVNSTTLAGRPVSYFSSAGNQGSAGGGGAIDVPVATF